MLKGILNKIRENNVTIMEQDKLPQLNKVVMYGTTSCPYCRLARQLFEKRGIEYTEYIIDRERHLREEMESLSNRTSVPQIFINDGHVGGFEELAELDMDGELNTLLGLS